MNGRILVIAVVLAIAIGGGFSTYVLFRDRAPLTPGPTASSRSSRDSAASPSPSGAAPRSETTTVEPRTPRKPAAPAEAPAPVATAPELGTLRIEADVPNAQVFLDRQFIGNAPVTAEHVKPGTHRLNVSAEGFDSVAQTLDVEPGPREVAIRFKEVRLD